MCTEARLACSRIPPRAQGFLARHPSRGPTASTQFRVSSLKQSGPAMELSSTQFALNRSSIRASKAGGRMLNASLISSKAQPWSARQLNPSSAGVEPRGDSDCVTREMTRLLPKISSTIAKETDQLCICNHSILVDVHAVNFSLSLGTNKFA